MGPTATALKTASEVIDALLVITQRETVIKNALLARAAAASISTFRPVRPFSTPHLQAKPAAIRPAKRNFHSASAHPTHGWLFRRSKDKSALPAIDSKKEETVASDNTPPHRRSYPIAYSYSLINAGETFYYTPEEHPQASKCPEPEGKEAEIRYPTAEELNTYFATRSWSLCLANAGDFHTPYSIPPEFLESLRSDKPAISPVAATSNTSAPTTATSKVTMASGDDEYAAFLDKASADHEPQASTKSASSNKAKHTTVTTSSVPAPLKNLKATYTSDADEPFEPVSLERKRKTSDINAEELADLIGAKKGAVSEIQYADFDPKGQYQSVLDTVKEVKGGGGHADVRVFKVEAGGARVEYWIVGIKDDNHIVGAKALAVES